MDQKRLRTSIIIGIIGVAAFAAACLLAHSNRIFTTTEQPLFLWINDWPNALYPLFLVITQLGSIVLLLAWGLAAYAFAGLRAGYVMCFAGLAAWLSAQAAKYLVARGRPGELLSGVHQHGMTWHDPGFPSGHATFSAACATVLFWMMPLRYRIYLPFIVVAVGVSRMYLGAHFPLDVLGGWGLGVAIGALALGINASRNKPAPPQAGVST